MFSLSHFAVIGYRQNAVFFTFIFAVWSVCVYNNINGAQVTLSALYIQEILSQRFVFCLN